MTCVWPSSTLSRFPTAARSLNYRLRISDSALSPLFVALPYLSPVSLLSTALTHLHGGGRGRCFPRDFEEIPTFDSQLPLSHQLTSCSSRNSFLFTIICVAGGGATPSFSQACSPNLDAGWTQVTHFVWLAHSLYRPEGVAPLFSAACALFCKIPRGGGPHNRARHSPAWPFGLSESRFAAEPCSLSCAAGDWPLQ